MSERDVESGQSADECGNDHEHEERRKDAHHEWERQFDGQFACRSVEQSLSSRTRIVRETVDHVVEWNPESMSGVESLDQRSHS